MSRNVLVIADLRKGSLRNVTFEAITAAVEIASGGSVDALLIGEGIRLQAARVTPFGATGVWLADDPQLAYYQPDTYMSIVETVARQCQPDAVLFAHSAVGRDLAPRLAAKLNAGQVSDVTGVLRSGEDILFTRPIYAGKAFTTNRFVQGPLIATIRPNNLPAIRREPTAEAKIVEIPVQLQPDNLRSYVHEVVQKSTQGVDLAEAKIIVSGGRGVKSKEGFAPLRELAEVLGAAVGASRGACDADYCDYSMQIGQTGKVVTPDLYIACGISGAIQHLAGMSASKVIVAINKDPDAPIFKVAAYGIVGDLFEVVPMLTEEFKRLQNNS
ncbi:MAG: Electron transfer flavoprotein alpha/beta-subunit [Bacilli bacterium]|nr:Electron transfer flavoprotein alpha/beta-subunit [Bacilli bacterium]